MSSELSTGAVFAERYRVERRLASGGMGAVYEVVHIETNRRRALKVLHGKFMQSEAVRERFRQEARVAAEVDSEHIVDIFDAGIDTETDKPFLVMELLRGEDLKARVRRDGPLPYDEVVRCLYETSLALEKTHRANIVHRDLKPDNLFLCEREHGPPRIKVLDFGIAKIVADGASETQVTQSLGTPLYMAPEQFSMSSSVSPQTDIFALGLIAFTLLVGKPYWISESKQAKSPIAFALHASKGPQESAIERAAKLGIKLPAAFDAWFFRATATKPADRFPSAMTATSELAEVLGVPLPHESIRGKSGPSPAEDQSPTSSAAHEAATADEPNPPNGPASVTLLSVRTIGSSALGETPPPSRPRPLFMLGGIVGLLMSGPLLDSILGTRTERMPAPASATSAITASASAEPPLMAAPDPLPSASSVITTPEQVTTPPDEETGSTKPTSSAVSTGTTPTQSPPVRPIVTTKKPPRRPIWNND